MIRIIHYIIGTALGSGFSPVAPGTAGSLLGILIFWFIPLEVTWQIFLAAVFLFTGVWSSEFIEKEKGKDPQIIVIDEVVGQWIALLFIPREMTWFIAAFLLFRLFDIFKPYPINNSQSIGGGWGIMIDDVIAGIYANIILQIILFSGIIS